MKKAIVKITHEVICSNLGIDNPSDYVIYHVELYDNSSIGLAIASIDEKFAGRELLEGQIPPYITQIRKEA
jgi:hypothetical protein